MSKNKSIIISVSIVLLIIISVSSFTYAYFVGRTDEKEVETESGELGVTYNITDNITGEKLMATSSREEGLRASAIARLNTSSVKALFNLYITPTTIDSGLAIQALKWEVDVIDKDGVVNETITGDFSGAIEDTAIKVINGYELTTDDTTFDIYIWLDSSLLTEPIDDKRFVANISADSVDITGTF